MLLLLLLDDCAVICTHRKLIETSFGHVSSLSNGIYWSSHILFSTFLSSLSFVCKTKLYQAREKNVCMCSVYVASWCWWNVHCRRALNKFSSFRQRKMKKKGKKLIGLWWYSASNCATFTYTRQSKIGRIRHQRTDLWLRVVGMINAPWQTLNE